GRARPDPARARGRAGAQPDVSGGERARNEDARPARARALDAAAALPARGREGRAAAAGSGGGRHRAIHARGDAARAPQPAAAAFPEGGAGRRSRRARSDGYFAVPPTAAPGEFFDARRLIRPSTPSCFTTLSNSER